MRMRHEDLKDADVGEDHDKEGAVEGDGGGEDEVAQVLSKQALPLRRRTCVWSIQEQNYIALFTWLLSKK